MVDLRLETGRGDLEFETGRGGASQISTGRDEAPFGSPCSAQASNSVHMYILWHVIQQ